MRHEHPGDTIIMNILILSITSDRDFLALQAYRSVTTCPRRSTRLYHQISEDRPEQVDQKTQALALDDTEPLGHVFNALNIQMRV